MTTPTLSDAELEAMLYVLDDEDLIASAGEERARILRPMWRRLHLTRLARQGDSDAAAMLETLVKQRA